MARKESALAIRRTVEGFPARVLEMQNALVEARTDFERVAIRDVAMAAQAAAAILKHKDIQILASHLVGDAERALAKANPPKAPGRPRKDQDRPRLEEDQDPALARLISATRSAHSRLSDDAYEELKRRSLQRGEPITRKDVRKAAKREQRELNPEAETRQTPLDAVQIQAKSLEGRIRALETENDDLRERVALSLDPEQERRYEGYREEILALRVQVGEWQGKYETERAIAQTLRKSLKNAQENETGLRAEIERLREELRS